MLGFEFWNGMDASISAKSQSADRAAPQSQGGKKRQREVGNVEGIYP